MGTVLTQINRTFKIIFDNTGIYLYINKSTFFHTIPDPHIPSDIKSLSLIFCKQKFQELKNKILNQNVKPK